MRGQSKRVGPKVLAILVLGAATSIAVGAQEGQEDAELRALREALPKSDAIVERDGALQLRSPGGSLSRIVGHDDGAPRIETPAGSLRVARDLLEGDRLSALDTLPELLCAIGEAEVDLAGLELQEGTVTGPGLRGAEVLVLPEGVLRRVEADEPVDLSALEAVVEGLSARLPETDLDPMARDSVAGVLAQVASRRGATTRYPRPDHARRLIRHGWLEQLLPEEVLAKELRREVERAERGAATTRFQGEGLHFAESEDGFRRRAVVLETPRRRRYARTLQSPHYFDMLRKLQVVVDLPVGVEGADASKVRAAAVYDGQRRIARWSREEGFEADAATWRQSVSVPRRRGESVLPDFLPPHVLIVDPDGDILSLVTAHGTLVPARDDSAEEIERFLGEAVVALPDAGHVDLIGEYLFHYVYDSPDPRRPLLIGSDEVHGEINQTVKQTLSTVTGGVCRGDCDDLAEVYHAILTRQGKLAHIMTLPTHAVLGWAEKGEDEQWRVRVLHTGQPREYAAKSLPAALEAAYRDLGQVEAFDPAQVGLSIRFSGENIRSQWLLGWRIFAEPDYARTMIDVQRDWHFRTYRRAIEKMVRLVDGGDDDPANYRELASLYERTGQLDLAARYLRLSVEAGDDPALNLGIRLVSVLYEAGKRQAAREEVYRLIDDALPSLQQKLGDRIAYPALELAGAIVSEGRDVASALEVIEGFLADQLLGRMARALRAATSRRAGDYLRVIDSEERRFLQRGMNLTVEVMRLSGPKPLAEKEALMKLAMSADMWTYMVGPRDVEVPGDLLDRYGTIGRHYAAVLGAETLRSMLTGATKPRKTFEHGVRMAGPGQIWRDLAWVNISLAFWDGELTNLYDVDRNELDEDAVRRAVAAMRAAQAEAQRLGMARRTADDRLLLAGLLESLVTDDAAGIRACFREVHRRGDKASRDLLHRWLGLRARFVPVARFAEVVAIWDEEMGYRPGYFEVAWTAVTEGAPAQALLMAEAAVRRFPDDAAFAAELAFMKELLSGN